MGIAGIFELEMEDSIAVFKSIVEKRDVRVRESLAWGEGDEMWLVDEVDSGARGVRSVGGGSAESDGRSDFEAACAVDCHADGGGVLPDSRFGGIHWNEPVWTKIVNGDWSDRRDGVAREERFDADFKLLIGFDVGVAANPDLERGLAGIRIDPEEAGGRIEVLVFRGSVAEDSVREGSIKGVWR